MTAPEIAAPKPAVVPTLRAEVLALPHTADGLVSVAKVLALLGRYGLVSAS